MVIHYVGIIAEIVGHCWLNSVASPSPLHGVILKVLAVWSPAWSFLMTSPPAQANWEPDPELPYHLKLTVVKSGLWGVTKDMLSQEVTRVLEALCQAFGAKTRYLSFLIPCVCEPLWLRRCGFNSWVRKIPWRRKWQPTRIRILAWEIPWTEEPGGQQSIGSQRVWHDWAYIKKYVW